MRKPIVLYVPVGDNVIEIPLERECSCARECDPYEDCTSCLGTGIETTPVGESILDLVTHHLTVASRKRT